MLTCSPPFTRLLQFRVPACMEETREGSPYNACSTLLSMECQVMDQQSASKPSTHGSLQQANLHKISTSCVSSNIDDDHEKEEHAHNGMLQGSMIFDMLSAMQFNSHSTINTIHEQANNTSFLNISTPSSQKAQMSSDGISSPWHLHLYNNNQRAIDTPYQGHIDTSYLSSKDHNMQQSTPTSGFDPISSFLKLPVLADQTKLGLADQRMINSYSSYASNNKEDHYGATQGYSSSNNNWFSSLQLESIRDCSNVNHDTIEDEGHVVQYLDHNSMEGASEEAKLLMKLNGEHASMRSHDNIGSHHEERALNESYNSSSMHMLSNYHNGEQLLYTLTEGGDIEGGQGSGMLDSMHMNMMMMGYNNDPKANAQFGVIKGGNVMGGNMKTTRKRGVRGTGKNSEERENQRMTHIAVERNRRRQMNEHLRVLRALMPPSYIQRGDQASIIGGAIEFVRELEQLLQCLESQKRRRIMANPVNVMPQPSIQQALLNTQAAGYGAPESSDHHLHHQLQAAPICMLDEGGLENIQEEVAQAKSAVADIEVKVVEKSEALIKILSQRRPRQLLHTIQALQDHLRLSILHTNVTTIDNTVLYSFTVKIHKDRDCSANHIATVVHGIFIDIINQNPIKDL